MGDLLFVAGVTAIFFLLAFELHGLGWFVLLLVLGCAICWRRLGGSKRRRT